MKTFGDWVDDAVGYLKEGMVTKVESTEYKAKAYKVPYSDGSYTIRIDIRVKE